MTLDKNVPREQEVTITGDSFLLGSRSLGDLPRALFTQSKGLVLMGSLFYET